MSFLVSSPIEYARLGVLFQDGVLFLDDIGFDFIMSGVATERLGYYQLVISGVVSHSWITALEEACRGNVCL